MKQNMFDPKSRSHFIGGIVRLAAHDFMDYDGDNTTHPFGPDGCFDPTHKANAGLPEEIWCSTCALTLLYEEKYMHLMSRADFWVASANSVIRQTSVNNILDADFFCAFADFFCAFAAARHRLAAAISRLPSDAIVFG